jgi:hypothetical protein
VPVTLLVAALLWFGFFPQFFVRGLAPTFRALAVTHEDASQAHGYNNHDLTSK